MINKNLLIMPILFFVLASFCVALGDWDGLIFVDSIQINDTSVVQAFRAGTTDLSTGALASDVVGTLESGYYLIHLTDPSSQFFFTVDGVNASAFITWSDHDHQLNLSMSKLAAGSSCTYSRGCSGGYCCSGATEYTDGSGTGTCQASACSAASTGGGGGGGTTALTTVISFTTAGVDVSLAKNNIAKFAFDSAYHTIKVIKIGADYVTLEIASDPVTITLNLLESRKLDLNNDNYYDLYVKLNEIKSSKAYLTVKYIHEIISPVVTPPTEEEEEEVTEEVEEEPEETPEEPEEVPPVKPIEEPPVNLTGIWILIVIIAIGLIAYLIYKKKK